MALSRVVSETFNVEKYRDLEICVRGHSWSRFTIFGDVCPFHASMLRPASQAGPMHESAGVREVS